MLSRTADHLFWMARYTERAENTARMLDVTFQAALLPQGNEAARRSWQAVLGISDLQAAYDAAYDKVSGKHVLDFVVRERSNPSSIAACLSCARENARAVRGSLTTEVWETLNTTWLELNSQLSAGVMHKDPGNFFEWVKYRSHLFRGVLIGTMLKDEAFYFSRLGTFLERADNTARILDVKFHAQPHAEGRDEPDPRDFYYWAALLRSVSAFEIYRRVYRDVITPAKVAELLMLRHDMPRSLLACLAEVNDNLSRVANDASADTERFAGRLHADLKYARIDEILSEGLHAYLTRFLERTFELGNRISRDFLVPGGN
ncbi:alpha-E domain-containing protein [Massilia sp. W12]|uniref:alpha-E domain-containing protein n=1 Tax=Massilia sp. W12 TaxID=3126507 RepID=UPI0030D48E58